MPEVKGLSAKKGKDSWLYLDEIDTLSLFQLVGVRNMHTRGWAEMNFPEHPTTAPRASLILFLSLELIEL